MKNNKTSVSIKNYILTDILLLVAMVSLVVYNAITYYYSATDSLMNIGENSLAREVEQVSSYIYKAYDTLEVTAVSVESLINEDNADVYIDKLLKEQTYRFQNNYDENFTGVYGYIKGNYVDGTDWVPPEGYDPKSRDWYVGAISEKNRKTVLVEPYVDAQTGSVLVSVSKALSDEKSVLALDVDLTPVQQITTNINMNGVGYGMVVNSSGFVIADASDKNDGVNLYDLEDKMSEIPDHLRNNSDGYYKASLDGKKSTIFYEYIIGDWYAVMIVSDDALYADVWKAVARNTLVCVIVFIVVYIFVRNAMKAMSKSYRNAEKSKKETAGMYLSIIQTLAKAIDAKDQYTNGHSQRVGQYSKEIARRMGKSEKEQEEIYHAAILHDVGKIRVDDSIINKKDRLDDEEYLKMKIHPLAGYHILRYVDESSTISQAAKEHHERYDGKGYPNGLAGENISEIGRICAVADAYDAMTSNRSYRNVMDQSKVRKQIEEGKGSQFDPAIADIMLQMIDEDKNYDMREKLREHKNVLLIDDDKMQHKLLGLLMKNEVDYKLFNATSSIEGIDSVKKNPIDLVLLDINMPEMDGFEVCKKIREFSNVPIVFLTADSSRDAIEKAADLGVHDYLVKPYSRFDILEVLHSLLAEQI